MSPEAKLLVAPTTGHKLAVLVFLIVGLAGLATSEPDTPEASVEFNPSPRQYLISPRIGRGSSTLWPLDTVGPQWAPEVTPSYHLAHFLPSAPRSLVFLVANRRLIGQRSGGLLPQARIGRASPMGLMPQPRVGRRSEPQLESRESAVDAISDTSFPDSIEALLNAK